MIKTIGASALLAATVGWNAWSVSLFGVPLTVVGMALAGAVLGCAYGTPIKGRKKLLMSVITYTFMASALVAVLPPVMGWEWSTKALEPPLAWLVAFSARFALPAVPWGEIIRKVFRLPPKQEGNSDESINQN